MTADGRYTVLTWMLLAAPGFGTHKRFNPRLLQHNIFHFAGLEPHPYALVDPHVEVDRSFNSRSLTSSRRLFCISIYIYFQVASSAPSPSELVPNGIFRAGLSFFNTTKSAVAADTNNTNDVYLYDLQTSALTLVSLNSNLTASANNVDHDNPVLSGDGRFVVYRSFATDIVPGIVHTPNIIALRPLHRFGTRR